MDIKTLWQLAMDKMAVCYEISLGRPTRISSRTNLHKNSKSLQGLQMEMHHFFIAPGSFAFIWQGGWWLRVEVQTHANECGPHHLSLARMNRGGSKESVSQLSCKRSRSPPLAHPSPQQATNFPLVALASASASKAVDAEEVLASMDCLASTSTSVA